MKIVELKRYQSAYLVPSSAVASDPLLTSYTPGAALGLFGSGSLETACTSGGLGGGLAGPISVQRLSDRRCYTPGHGNGHSDE